jgi:hypothetical protein
MFGLGFRLGARARRRFSPRVLFANGEQGVWFDPSDLATMFQDVAATIPAVVGAAVARIDDKSGRGNHAGQPTAAARPVLRQDAGGRYYLEFDGTDDRLVTAGFALAQPWERVSAIRQVSWASGRRIFTSGNGALAGLLYQNPASPQLCLFDGFAAGANGGAAVGAAAVVTERHNGAASQLAVNGGAAVAGNAGGTAASGISIGADPGGTNPAAFHFYGLCLVRAGLSEAQIAALRSHFAAKAGVAP